MGWQTPDMIPVYGFLEGDTLGLLLVTHPGEKIHDLADKLRRAGSVRVETSGRFDLVHDGHVLDPDWTVGQTAIRPLDRVDAVRRERS